MNGKSVRYHLLALAVVAVWGITFVSTKVLIGAGMHPVAIFFIRFVMAYAGIWVYTWLYNRLRSDVSEARAQAEDQDTKDR